MFVMVYFKVLVFWRLNINYKATIGDYPVVSFVLFHESGTR